MQQIDVLYTNTSPINNKVQVGDKERKKEKQGERKRGREGDAPIGVPISVVVAEEVVLSCCLVAGYLQRLVDRREQVFTQTRDLQDQSCTQ